ncbi:hypothetical protein [uncultured Oscillibacter sp.]|uniref:hypothetical protein n=1 Tax=uncultured Oscillibacter sp. TaxID=876091 RepID=UPI0025E0EB96|nr:hypothetical protein [uncultured Oscillibacter sp.]
MRKTKRLLCALSALVMAAGLTACGKTAAGPETVPPAPAQSTEAAQSAPAESGAAERTRTETVLLDGQETTAYLDVTDEDIQFWDSPSGGTLLAAARYPKALPGAADALESCDLTDLDGDGNSDLSASFRFGEDGAQLLWFYADGGFAYNEEFSWLPGETPPSG